VVAARSLVRRGWSLLGSVPLTDWARSVFADWRRSPPLMLAAVYRRHNSANLVRLIDAEGFQEGEVALWALDGEHPDLAAHTVGQGPGGRFALLRACMGALNPTDDTWWVLADDDVALPRKGLRRTAVVARDMALDIAQPAHTWNSYYTYPFTLARPLLVARQTDFVEIGPVVVVGPDGRAFLESLSDVAPMGWGVDVRWSGGSRAGLVRLGIVDLVGMRHLQRPGRSYPTAAENEALGGELAAAGVDSVPELQRTRRRWWVWQRSAPPECAG
jgi:hypothetical protein